MLSKDYSAEFKQRFADRYADGATITMPQREFGLAKSTARLWRERIDQGGVGAIDRPRKSNRYPQEFKLRVAEAYLRGEGDRKALALEHGVRNGAQIRDRVKRYREGGEDALAVRPPGRRRKGPASGETPRAAARPPRDGGGDLKTNGRLGDGHLGSRRKHEAAKSPRREYPLSVLLELIGMPRSTYCHHEANPPSDRQAAERPAIVGICEKSQFRYGYRRVADTLRKATGIRIADKTVLKVMREEGLPCRTRRRRRHRSHMGRVGKSPRTCSPATSRRGTRWPSR